MTVLRRKQRGSRHSVLRRPGRRSPPAGRSGLRRLAALYEIGKLLTHFAETPQKAVLPFLSIMTKELPLRCALLSENISERPKTIVWHAPDIRPAELAAAKARAQRAFVLLTRATAPPGEVIEVNASLLMPAPAADTTADGSKDGKFITCPLSLQGRPIFGALHLEGAAAFDEEDVAFTSAIAVQLAVALNRNQGRLNETALRRKAEELGQFKTDLVSVVSHEFSNALAVIKSATHLIKQKQPPGLLKENDELFRMIVANVDGIALAIQNLLGRGRIEAGKFAVDLQATDASKILRNTLNRLELLCQKKKLHVSLEIADAFPLVRADSAALGLVISNLLSNAIKYTPENGSIVLGLRREESRPDYCRIFVQDTGIGVSEEDRAKILGGHFRSDSGKKMTSHGFGVGLSLAQQIVEAHGSTIDIEGGPKKGSRFSFLLPLFAAETTGDKKENHSPP